jgi:hypothetical protein
MAGAGGDPRQGCLDSGGKVESGYCCESVDDFFEYCSGVIGACGCGPANSHEVMLCSCPDGMCFDGERCR